MPGPSRASWRHLLQKAESYARELDAERRRRATARAMGALALFGVDLGMTGEPRDDASERERTEQVEVDR